MGKAAGRSAESRPCEGELAFLENAGPVELEAEQALALPALQALARKPAVTSDYRLEGQSINPFLPGHGGRRATRRRGRGGRGRLTGPLDIDGVADV